MTMMMMTTMIDRFSGLTRRVGSLRRDGRGAVAVIFALMTPAILGGLALTIDVAMYRIAHARLQAAADAAALAGLQEMVAGGDLTNRAVEIAGQNVSDEYGEIVNAGDVQVGSYSSQDGFTLGGADPNAVRVVAQRTVARGNPVRQIFSVLFDADQANIGVDAIAARPFNVFYEPPELTILDNEAGDVNEMYVYCYQTQGGGTAASRRSQMTLIANNMPGNRNLVNESKNAVTDNNRAPAPLGVSQGKVTANPPSKDDVVWPRCDEEGQTLSFRLKNIRHAKSNTQLWNSPGATISNRQPRRPVYDHFTDSVINDGVESFGGLTGKTILETVRCDSLDKCNPAKSGNAIGAPKKNKTPRVDGNGCEPGKFMYFGWEDRPGGSGAKGDWLDPDWTDKDFDDIAVVMRCPRSGQLGDGRTRLVG